MEIPTENPLLVAFLGTLFGALVTSLLYKIGKKTSVIGYTTDFNKIGLSADDGIFGSVRMTWEGHQVRNLYLYSIDVENSTTRDFESLPLKVFTGGDTVLLNEKTEVVDSPFIVIWSGDYSERMKVAEGEEASQAQIQEYNRNREYMVPVFNRGQRLKFTYLCSRPNDDDDPFICLATNAAGVKLKRNAPTALTISPIFGVPILDAAVRGILITIVLATFASIYIDRIWIVAAFCTFSGLFAQVLGVGMYKLERLIKNVFAG